MSSREPVIRVAAFAVLVLISIVAGRWIAGAQLTVEATRIVGFVMLIIPGLMLPFRGKMRIAPALLLVAGPTVLGLVLLGLLPLSLQSAQWLFIGSIVLSGAFNRKGAHRPVA